MPFGNSSIGRKRKKKGLERSAADVQQEAPSVLADAPLPSNDLDKTLFKMMQDLGEPILEDLERVRRQTIAYLVVYKFGATANKSEWKGNDGIIPKIKDCMNLPKGLQIEYVLDDVLTCIEEGY